MQETQPYGFRDTIENIPGHWAKAAWQGTLGYVFDGFLSALPAPDISVNTLEAYCERYFEKRKGTFFLDSMEDERVNIQHYQNKYWLIELESASSAEDAEAWGTSSIMTFTNHGRIMTPEELYLLMSALFRGDIDTCLEKIKTGKHDFYEFYETAHENYFQFVRGATSGSYEFPSGLYLTLDYGICIHGAYIGFGTAD